MLQRLRGFMRTIIYTGLILTATAGAAFAADPNGDWLVEEGTAQIRIVDCNNSKWGVVAWEKIPGGIDNQNPDAFKKTRPTLGMPILLNMKKKNGSDEWEGSVYNAKNGKIYDSSIKPLAGNKLEIKGCVLGFLCGGETWTRVGEPIPSPPPGAPKSGSAGQQKTTGPAPKAGAMTQAAPTAASGSAKNSTASKAGTAPANPLDDICAIPEIAKATGTTGRAVN